MSEPHVFTTVFEDLPIRIQWITRTGKVIAEETRIAPAVTEHFCVRCQRRWTGGGVTEYCGDCHRTALQNHRIDEAIERLRLLRGADEPPSRDPFLRGFVGGISGSIEVLEAMRVAQVGPTVPAQINAALVKLGALLMDRDTAVGAYALRRQTEEGASLKDYERKANAEAALADAVASYLPMLHRALLCETFERQAVKRDAVTQAALAEPMTSTLTRTCASCRWIGRHAISGVPECGNPESPVGVFTHDDMPAGFGCTLHQPKAQTDIRRCKQCGELVARHMYPGLNCKLDQPIPAEAQPDLPVLVPGTETNVWLCSDCDGTNMGCVQCADARREGHLVKQPTGPPR